MLIEYIPIIILTVLAAALGVLVVIIGRVFGPHRPTRKKGNPYESGMIPYGAGARRMSVRYYLVAVLFILFDVEVVFFLPWAVAFRSLGLFSLIEMFVFVAIMAVGYIYVWKKGALEWE
jgi:NADH-quinone oxidoreductase subunit A